METAPYLQAIAAATSHPHPVVTTITNGLINDTYKVDIAENGDLLLLQQINTRVFDDPGALQDNYEKIWSNLEATRSASPDAIWIPAPRNFTNGDSLFRDRNGKYWRLFDFIDNTENNDSPANDGQARAVARTFALLTANFENYDLSSLHPIIPGFHDLSLRFEQFKKSLHSHQYDRLLKAASTIEQLKSRERYVNFYEVIVSSGEFKQRLMHHDAKISNILFDKDSGKPVCPVDLDTCMPGYFFSDLGDMIRSMAGSVEENYSEQGEVRIREHYYHAIVDGYLEILSPLLTASEKKYIHYAGLLMVYMQALRFTSDYLLGDNYYRTTHPEQNLDRANNQLMLLDKLEEFLQKNYALRY